MVTVVPVNMELTATVTWAQMSAIGVPVLLSPTFTEYVLVDVNAPVENEEEFPSAIGVAHTSPLYH